MEHVTSGDNENRRVVDKRKNDHVKRRNGEEMRFQCTEVTPTEMEDILHTPGPNWLSWLKTLIKNL